MRKFLPAAAALALFISSAALAEPVGKIQLSGQVLAPAACRAESDAIRKPADFKLFCGVARNGVAATPVHSVSISPINGSAKAFVIQITYL
ncbi:hypothetical protein RAS12_00090 [Achromobacter seleniivolatilans]|uniref:Type 1 fimbrial protein n=1 Tax=Achromobacter seleniivolatilans TaxID=3047478 RepID=A0ABY9M2H8_9BURK|nr:hypothetical protein [Achromobacter sp. R39]WMD20808.1 hypothetical protein RAS12_00090 [Achromobacter sp. R39]